MKAKATIKPGAFARKGVAQMRAVPGPSTGAEGRRAWFETLEAIHAAMRRLDVRANEDWWFRGQASHHSLKPSLYRLLDQDFNERDDDAQSIYELEYDLYFDFSCRAPGMQDPGLSSWDKLASMRHHGLPTRLLDWTERLGVALYFALTSALKPGGCPVIWILSPCRLNQLVLRDRDLYSPKYLGYDSSEDEYWDYEDYLISAGGTFDWDGPVAIYPEQKNPRMRSQLGWFTIFGEDTNSLEKQFSSRERRRLIERVEIPLEAIPAACEFLTAAGIDEYSIFPDIDGFCGFLKTHYGIPR